MDTFTCPHCGFETSHFDEGLCHDCYEHRQMEEDLSWQEWMEDEFGRNYTDGIGY